MFCVTISLKPVASVHHGLVVFYKCATSWIHAMDLVTDHISKISTAIGRVRPFLRTFVRFYCSWPLTTDPDIFSCEQVINDHSSPEIKVKVIGQCQRSKQKCVCYTNVYTAAFYDYWLIDGRSSRYRLWRHQLQASGEVNGVAAAAESRARSVWPRSSTEGSSLVARLTVADGQQTESLELTGKWWRRRETDPRHLTLLFDPTTANRSPTRSLIWSNHDAATSPIRRKARPPGANLLPALLSPSENWEQFVHVWDLLSACWDWAPRWYGYFTTYHTMIRRETPSN